jgi:hypothetical protein
MSNTTTPQSKTFLPTARTYTERDTRPGTSLGGTYVVSRTAADLAGGHFLFEITVIRSWRQKHATYQGAVVLFEDGWHAEGANARGGATLIGVFAEYRDAEDALVARKTGLTSAQPWTGPRPLQPIRPKCGVCGNRKAAWGATCPRLDTHWAPGELTPAAQRADHYSIAA